MPPVVSLLNKSVVLVANQLNVSIFKPFWFEDNRILTREELEGQLLITPAAVQISTPGFELLIVPNRLQLRFVASREDEQEIVDRIIGGIVAKLPHTPATGVGLNIDFMARPAEQDRFAEWNQEEFSSSYGRRMAAGASFVRHGTYFLLDRLGMRLNVTVRPVTNRAINRSANEPRDEVGEAAKIEFNFHADVAERDLRHSVPEHLRNWAAACDMAEGMLREIPGLNGG